MKKLLFLLFAISLFAIAGCSNDKSETSEKKTVAKEIAETKVSEKEARKVAEKVYTDLVDAIYDAGDENNWGADSKPDMAILEKVVKSYATTKFINDFIEPSKDDLYCECDSVVFPAPAFTARFELMENAAGKFTVYSIEPMSELGTPGQHITISFLKEKKQWKIDKLEMEDHLSTPLDLTWEEAKPYLEELYKQDIVLTEETMLNDKETSKAYLFIVEGDPVVKGIYANSGEIIHDVTALKAANDKKTETVVPEDKEATQEQPKAEENKTVTQSQTTVSSKAEYLAMLDGLHEQEQHTDTGVTVDLLEDNGYNFTLWDNALNEIYGALKTQLSEASMNDLRAKQRQWITDRDAEAQQRADEEGGGTLSTVVYGETKVELTKARCYELVNLYMK
jgi:uncharacterized protein YecT (DUF1311 family)